MRRARTYAAVLALGAVLLAFFQVRGDGEWPSTLPWVSLCLAAAALAVGVAAKRPFVLLSAAHAGLTATWAGSLAGQAFGPMRMWPHPSMLAVGLLAGLGLGMGGLTALSMKLAPRNDPAPNR